MSGDLVTAEVVLTRPGCRHRVAWADFACNCQDVEVTALVAGEVFVPNNDELDAEIHVASVDGVPVVLSMRETQRCEDELINRWSELFETKAG